MKFSLNVLLKHLLYARRSQKEDIASHYWAAYGHPNAAEYLFIRHLYDMLPSASGPGERFLSYKDSCNYVVMYPPHIWDCDGDVGIDRGSFRVVTRDHGYALQLINGQKERPSMSIYKEWLLPKAWCLIMANLDGHDWARSLEIIIQYEHHFLAPLRLREELPQHYLHTFHSTAANSQHPADVTDDTPAPNVKPAANEAPIVTLDPAFDRIEQHDGWI